MRLREWPTTWDRALGPSLSRSRPRRRAPPTAPAFPGQSRQGTVGTTADGRKLSDDYIRLNMLAVVLSKPPPIPEPTLHPVVPQSKSQKSFKSWRHLGLFNTNRWICSGGPRVHRPLLEIYHVIMGVKTHEWRDIPRWRSLRRRRHRRRRSLRRRRKRLRVIRWRSHLYLWRNFHGQGSHNTLHLFLLFHFFIGNFFIILFVLIHSTTTT